MPGAVPMSFLRVANEFSALIGKSLESQLNLLDSASRGISQRQLGSRAIPTRRPAQILLDRAQCLEFAVGSIARGAGAGLCLDRQPSHAGSPARRAAHAGRSDRDDRGRASGRSRPDGS